MIKITILIIIIIITQSHVVIIIIRTTESDLSNYQLIKLILLIKNNNG